MSGDSLTTPLCGSCQHRERRTPVAIGFDQRHGLTSEKLNQLLGGPKGCKISFVDLEGDAGSAVYSDSAAAHDPYLGAKFDDLNLVSTVEHGVIADTVRFKGQSCQELLEKCTNISPPAAVTVAVDADATVSQQTGDGHAVDSFVRAVKHVGQLG